MLLPSSSNKCNKRRGSCPRSCRNLPRSGSSSDLPPPRRPLPRPRKSRPSSAPAVGVGTAAVPLAVATMQRPVPAMSIPITMLLVVPMLLAVQAQQQQPVREVPPMPQPATTTAAGRTCSTATATMATTTRTTWPPTSAPGRGPPPPLLVVELVVEEVPISVVEEVPIPVVLGITLELPAVPLPSGPVPTCGLQRFLRRQQQEQEQQGQQGQGQEQQRRNRNHNNNNNNQQQQNQPQQNQQQTQQQQQHDEDESALIHRLAREADALVAARRDRMRRQQAGAAAAARRVDAADAAHRDRRLNNSNNNNEGGDGENGNGVPAAAGAAPVRGDSEDEEDEDIVLEPRGGGGPPRRVDAAGGAGDDANANAVPADDEAEDNNNNNRLGNRGADGAAAGARAAAAADLVSDGGDDEDEDHRGHPNDASDMDVDDASSTGGDNNNIRSSLSGKKRRRRARSRDGGGDGDDDPSSSSSSDDDNDDDDSISSADHRGDKDRRDYDRRYDRDAAGEDGYHSSFSNSSDDDLYLYPTDSDADQSDSDSEDDLLDEYRYYTANTDRTDDDNEEESGYRWVAVGEDPRRRLVQEPIPGMEPQQRQRSASAGRAGRGGPDAAAAAAAGSRERRRQRSRRRQRRRRSDGSGLDDDANDAAPPVNLNDVAGSSPARARRLGGRPTRGPSLLLWGRPGEQTAATGYRMYSSSMAEEGTWEAIRNRIRTERKIRDRDKQNPAIPRTWLSAAFTASSDYSGLALSAPPPEEVAYLRLIHCRANRRSRSSGTKLDALPPYHCTGATLLLSLVTSMMYSGASIQCKSVNCSRSSRKPFAELTEEERKREFEPRLADALAAILYAAAKNSAKRREAAIQRLERRVKREERGSLKQSKSRKKGKKKSNGDGTDKDDADKEKDVAYLDWQRMRIQQLRRRLRLCPVARWEDIPLTNGPLYPPRPSSLPDGGDSDDDTNNDDRSSGSSLNGGAEVKISVSYTNIADLRQYVEATMKSFCAPGGCALFLETLVRIAGIKRIRRCLSNEKVPSKIMESVSITPALLACTCCDRARGTSSTHKSGHGKKSTEAKDFLPTGHGCLSPHLINILLGGAPTNNLASTTTGELGVGIISMNDGGRNGGSAGCDTFGPYPALLNPSHPIWLVCGELCYSVLRVSEDSLPDPSMRQSLHHGAGVGSDSFVLTHQNPWYGCKHTTEMRIHPAKPAGGDLSPKSSAAEIAGTHKPSPGTVSHSGRKSISQEEIDTIVIHPQDKSYYPKDYRHWRFDFSSVADTSSASAAVGEENSKSDSKLPAVDGNASVQSVSSKEQHQKWTPFYRLSTRQRLVVEAKLAPKINLVVSKRFPGSSVSFKPGVEPPFV